MKKVDYRHFGRFLCPCNLRKRDNSLYFTLRETDFDKNRYKYDLYRLDLGDNEPRRLTASGDVSRYWLTEKGVLFISKRRERKEDEHCTDLYLLPYDGGEALLCLSLSYNVGDIVPLSDGRFFFTAEYDHAYACQLAMQGDGERAKEDKELEKDYTVIDEYPFWFNGEGFINKKRQRLYLYSGGAVTAITGEYASISSLLLSPDESLLCYVKSEYKSMRVPEDKLMLLSTQSLKALDISAGDGRENWRAAFMDAGLLFMTEGGDGSCPDLSIYLRDLKTGETKALAHDRMHYFANSSGTDIKAGRAVSAQPMARGDGLYMISTVDDSAHLVRYDIKEQSTRVITREKGIVCEALMENDGFFTVAMRALGGQELYFIGKNGEEQKLTHFNDSLESEYERSEILDFTFESEDGSAVHGFVLAPSGLEKGKKYPTILDIHGGPRTAYSCAYFHEMQLWASRGYAVIFCNPHGSDGGGEVFADLRGKYGSIDYRDIMTFVDTACQKYDFIDSDRIGVTGGSYGGFMTNWIIGHTHRFKAAASQRSISNWVSFANMADIGHSFGLSQHRAKNAFDAETLWSFSPLKYAENCKTPTLFIHSEEDYRCPLAEGMQMFTAIRCNGVEARMCVFKGENHELSRSGKPLHRVRRLKEITEWMDRYLRDK